MRETLTLKKDVPVAGDYDVVVCGGGPAGLMAAISAARAGQRTALIERMGFFGGTATAGFVVPISGFFHKGRRVVGGIAWELVSRLVRRGAAQVELPKGHISFHPEFYKLLAQEMVDESGVDAYTNAWVSGCRREGSALSHVVYESKSGTEAIAGRCFIDATGEADLCRMAQVPMLSQSAALQPLSLCFLLEGVDLSTDLLRNCIHHTGEGGRPSCNAVIRAYLDECVARGTLERFGGPWFNALVRGGVVAVNVTRRAGNAACRASMQEAERRLRQDMFAIVDLLRARFPEFQNCQIVCSGANAGARETARIRGLSVVTGDDMRSGRTYPCPVARCAHPMDLHRPDDSTQKLIPLERAAYVPHTALIPHGVENLIAAGRCVSCDAQAYASLRVQATCMAIGESAGVLAAQSCMQHAAVGNLDLDPVCEMLRARGIVL
ncbi:MAG TPA: FAD-dependent oxidoreductase [Candidatus Faecivicinus avistercoris]|nr:FAD-dependent oxidoreductase [Candidatus Faecivicinus avistercoris]